jgi:small GTP-binding protein
MDLERERGITIKSHAIQMEYERNGQKYILNLIDTPGHVDFSYEVSRSIAACEGALLVVDATQGVQAQTISNLYMAIDHNLEIIPVINKIDMPSAMPDEVEDEIVDLIGCDPQDIIRASGKTGEGVGEILDAIVDLVPHPEGDPDAPLQALIFDSVFNSFRGIIAYFKIVNGSVRKGDLVKVLGRGEVEGLAGQRGVAGDLDQRAFEPADVFRNVLCHEFDHGHRQIDLMGGGFGLEDRDAGLEVGRLDIGGQAPLKTGNQAGFERGDLGHGTVARNDDLFL